MRRTGELAAWGWAMLVSVQVPGLVAAGTVVEDVLIRESRAAAHKSWQRVLVGRLADSDGYFASAIADGADSDTPGADGPQTELWRFSSGELGETDAYPRIFLTNARDAEGGTEWGVALAGGYDAATGAAKLFVLFIDRGIDGWSGGDFIAIPAAVGEPPGQSAGAPVANGLGEPALVDVDLDGTADLAYAGDLLGNLYRFDIADTDPARWSALLLFQATYGEPVRNRQPITLRPTVRAHREGDGFLVVFATGTGYRENELAPMAIQSIYGIWDRGDSNPVTARPGAKNERLVGRTLINLVDEVGGSFVWRRTLTGEPVALAADAPGRRGLYGWYLDLDMVRAEWTLQGGSNPDSCGLAPPDPQYPGERAVGRLIPRGDTLFVTTVVPGDLRGCPGAPSGSLLAIDIATGGNPPSAVLDLNDDGLVDGGDLATYQGEAQAAGIVLHSDDLSGAPRDTGLVSNPDGTALLVVGNGDGHTSLAVGAGGPSRTGRLSWRELREPVP